MKPRVEIKELSEAPNFKELQERFNVGDETIISYGDKIFVKNRQLTGDLMVHELVHCERQGFNESGAKRWYEIYMRDDEFRLQEELLAYRQQYAYCCRIFKDRNRRAKILWALATELSSPRYGSIISHSEAIERIK